MKAGEYRESVLFGYQAIRIELTLAGVPRRRNEELLDYARMLADFREGFDRRMTTVVLAFTRRNMEPERFPAGVRFWCSGTSVRCAGA